MERAGKLSPIHVSVCVMLFRPPRLIPAQAFFPLRTTHKPFAKGCLQSYLGLFGPTQRGVYKGLSHQAQPFRED